MPERWSPGWYNGSAHPGVQASENPADLSDGSVALGTGLTSAFNAARDARQTLVLRGGTYWLTQTAEFCDDISTGSHRGERSVRVMSYPGERAIIKLHPTLAAANFPATPRKKPVIHIYKKGTPGIPTPADRDDRARGFHECIQGITIDTNGVPNAWGLDVNGHQHCYLGDCEIIATGSAGGIASCFGTGSANRNLTVTGGQIGIQFTDLYTTEANVGVVLTDVTVNITEPGAIGILVNGQRSSAALNDVRIYSSQATGIPIQTAPVVTASTSSAFLAIFSAFRLHVEFTGAPGVGVDNSGRVTDNLGQRAYSICQSEFVNCTTPINNGPVDGVYPPAGTVTAGATFYIQRYVYGPAVLNGQGRPSINGVPITQKLNGTKTDGGGASIGAGNGLVAGPVPGLVGSLHVDYPNICDPTRWAWLTEDWEELTGITPEDITTGVIATTDQRAQIQAYIAKAAARNMGVFVPKGRYGVGAPGLSLSGNSQLMMDMGSLAYFAVTSTWANASATTAAQEWLFDTPDDVGATYRLWFLYLHSGREQRNVWIGALRYRGGENTWFCTTKIDMVAARYCDTPSTVVEFSGNSGGRVLGFQDHARILNFPAAGQLPIRIGYVPGFKQVVVRGVGRPGLFCGFNAELIGGSDTPNWNGVVPEPSVVFDGCRDKILAGSKWEQSGHGVLIEFVGDTRNCLIELAASHDDNGPSTPEDLGTFINVVSDARGQAQAVIHNAYWPSPDPSLPLINEIGYTETPEITRNEFALLYRRGPAFEPAALPYTFLSPPEPVGDSTPLLPMSVMHPARSLWRATVPRDRDAAAYFRAVDAAGGLLHASTRRALNRLFSDLRHCGVLDAITRMNLFCTGGFEGVHIPQIGNSVDTFPAGFPSSIYAYASGFTKTAVTGQYIITDYIPPEALPWGLGMLVAMPTLAANADIMGCNGNAATDTLLKNYYIAAQSANNRVGYYHGSLSTFPAIGSGTTGRIYSVHRFAPNRSESLADGLTAGIGGAAGTAFSIPHAVWVGTRNSAGVESANRLPIGSQILGYYITNANASTEELLYLHNALQQFMRAIGRGVG
jgi:hypothetical protein